MGIAYRSTLGEPPTGNAVVGDVLYGKTFSNADGTDKVGTMPNNGAVAPTALNPGGSYTIPAGYHNGQGAVSAKSNTATYTASSRGAALDMGAANLNRYVNTNGVPNSNTGTYTFPANDTGGTKDLGEANNYRYVNAQNVYNKGKADGSGQCVIHNFRLTHTYESTALGIEITNKKTNTVKVNKTVNSTGPWGSNPTNVNETVDGITYTLDINQSDWTTVKLIATSGSKSKTYSAPVSPNWSYAYTLDFLVIYDNNFY